MTVEQGMGEWDAVYEACAPYGEGEAPYTREDTAALYALREAELSLLQRIDEGGLEGWVSYQTHLCTYLHRCCRYYFYRGMLHGSQEALSIWRDQYGS